jgi:triosephosphate isomerase
MNKILLGTNLKMYKTAKETGEYLKELGRIPRQLLERATFFVIPSFIALPVAKEAVKNTPILLGAQNMHWEEKGQFTGEISPRMLQDLGGISIIEVGHSERRHTFGETSQECGLKVASAIKHGFTALLCVGETAEDKELNVCDEVLRMQIKIGLKDVRPDDIYNVWLAYEPVWSIGVYGKPAPNTYIQERYNIIRSTLSNLFGEDANKIPVLYGGSVNMQNAESLIKETDIEGLFIGRAAWDASNFIEISKKVIDAKKWVE